MMDQYDRCGSRLPQCMLALRDEEELVVGREDTMANWQELLETLLSSTGFNEDADVTKAAIFMKRYLRESN